MVRLHWKNYEVLSMKQIKWQQITEKSERIFPKQRNWKKSLIEAKKNYRERFELWKSRIAIFVPAVRHM